MKAAVSGAQGSELPAPARRLSIAMGRALRLKVSPKCPQKQQTPLRAALEVEMSELTESQRSGLNRRPLGADQVQFGGVSRSSPSIASEKHDRNTPAEARNSLRKVSPSCPPTFSAWNARFELTATGREALNRPGLSSKFPIFGNTVSEVLNWIHAHFPGRKAPGCFGSGFWF